MPKHAETRVLPYRPDQIFDLVADVTHYPAFLPWCVAARLRSRTETELVADLTIGFGPFRESFTSRVTLDRPSTITVRYERGPFRYLRNVWKFTPHASGCQVDFFVDFEFNSRILQAAIGVVFTEATRLMVSAFIKRAKEVYGPPALQAGTTATPAALSGQKTAT
ncbi:MULTISPECIES: type II toxin-antitoxin system RatA family toxin [Acetobacter]|jgi:coenzyme Q-binding protein COQ10|uniref:Coenzyme Q-binding protein COQ10 n=1 Tax=Acetobacter lovaniensis TaxID=104100 RepID=A0A841QAV2_9PROT|nr:type II toxin-antitoxin system RatA family toxin [Acetobacter lovaniensis]MBB6455515.1 coenzyme Q-binding protein COQ10 [Acetobacter lovaniensis]MCI1697548.1 type II toxin-antitoxin system RatA family toxin [Acetobacter lovaniensis]MCI1795982.1 type II toxin-antitoxin system RatA family toxin [Acetobacter lovaniensis]MCP1238647.1 type II toxin-antitoxin system RatA family toxin [Acetobacter lovaniensis]NHN79919.1 type II toxin-antitoxin system RatA family toxin [Acetobacter lovaniensis]